MIEIPNNSPDETPPEKPEWQLRDERVARRNEGIKEYRDILAKYTYDLAKSGDIMKALNPHGEFIKELAFKYSNPDNLIYDINTRQPSEPDPDAVERVKMTLLGQAMIGSTHDDDSLPLDMPGGEIAEYILSLKKPELETESELETKNT